MTHITTILKFGKRLETRNMITTPFKNKICSIVFNFNGSQQVLISYHTIQIRLCSCFVNILQ